MGKKSEQLGGCWYCGWESTEPEDEFMPFSREWDAWYHPSCHYKACLEEGWTLPV